MAPANCCIIERSYQIRKSLVSTLLDFFTCRCVLGILMRSPSMHCFFRLHVRRVAVQAHGAARNCERAGGSDCAAAAAGAARGGVQLAGAGTGQGPLPERVQQEPAAHHGGAVPGEGRSRGGGGGGGTGAGLPAPAPHLRVPALPPAGAPATRQQLRGERPARCLHCVFLCRKPRPTTGGCSQSV